jgi:hypothetical protein
LRYKLSVVIGKKRTLEFEASLDPCQRLQKRKLFKLGYVNRREFILAGQLPAVSWKPEGIYLAMRSEAVREADVWAVRKLQI